MRDWFILVPALIPTGPIKGAIALANKISKDRRVNLVYLKEGSGASTFIDPRIKIISLAEKNFFGKLKTYRQMIRSSGDIKNISLSYCFSADFLNSFCGNQAIISSSIRANMIKNYKLEYGFIGIFLAIFHLIMLNRFNKTFAMNESMAKQVSFYSKKPSIIGNFIDEDYLLSYRTKKKKEGVFKILFLGSLTRRKQPLLLVQTLITLKDSNDLKFDCYFVGTGPLKENMLKVIKENECEEFFHVLGQIDNPYSIIAESDIMVLPSLSEGVPRSALESLFLGTPCILRDVDGNKELINNGFNGFIFKDDKDLGITIKEALEFSRVKDYAGNLLPKNNIQAICARKYLDILESLH